MLKCLSTLQIYSFSKNYSSSFKLRSKLAQFFKHVHPDQMNQAPTKVRDQNMLSLKNFNEYIDAVNQQKPIQAKLLKFYISQKTNHKSKKFYSFNLELPQVQPSKLNEQKAQRLLNDIVQALNSKFKESQQIQTKKQTKKNEKQIKIQEQQKFQTQEQKIKRMQSTVSPFDQYRSHKNKVTQKRLQNQINSKYLQQEKINLETKLRRKVSFADTKTNRPMMWSKIAMEESGLYKDYQDILDNLIDPKLIYFDQKLQQYQIDQFKKNMLPGSINAKDLKGNYYINQVCQLMESYNPPLCFYVSDHYSSKDIPGFFSVPYNFTPQKLAENFHRLKDEVVEQQQTYTQLYQYYQQLVKSLQKNNNFIVDSTQFKGIADISQRILMLKRLQKYKIQYKIHPKVTLFPMSPQDFKVYLQSLTKYAHVQKEDSIPTVMIKDSYKILHLIMFKDEDMKKIFNQIHVIQQLNYKYSMQ